MLPFQVVRLRIKPQLMDNDDDMWRNWGIHVAKGNRIIIAMNLKNPFMRHANRRLLLKQTYRCLTHPLDTAKARLQALSAAQYNYRGPVDVLRQTFHKEGIRGLYRGFGGVIVGGTPGTILYLCSYDICKERLSQLQGPFFVKRIILSITFPLD
jgi:hypothetical protein